MLIEFTVGNFRSFKKPVTLSFSAAKPIKEHRDENVFSAGRFNLLRSAAVYGANASGKSNLLSALVFMRHFVLTSSKDTQASEPIGVVPFLLDSESAGSPSHFEVAFVRDGATYRYGFEVNKKEVVAEWLFRSQKVAASPLFLRDADGIQVKPKFPEGQGLEKKTRPNALFLSVCAQFNGEMATSVLTWFRGIVPVHGLMDRGYTRRAIEMLSDANAKVRLLSLLREADLGIEDILVSEEEIDNTDLLKMLSEEGVRRLQPSLKERVKKSLSSVHARYDSGRRVGSISMDFNSAESAGTEKFLALAGPVLGALSDGGVVVVDELDAQLHPLLSMSLVRLFNSKLKNPRNAQLLFATHDTNLLRHGGLRRDQIWFVEKDQQESSDLYSLAEFKQPDGSKVRNDASFQKDYLEGRYGAIPFLGDLGSQLGGEK